MFEAKWRMCVPYCGGLAYQLILFTSLTKGRLANWLDWSVPCIAGGLVGQQLVNVIVSVSGEIIYWLQIKLKLNYIDWGRSPIFITAVFFVFTWALKIVRALAVVRIHGVTGVIRGCVIIIRVFLHRVNGCWWWGTSQICMFYAIGAQVINGWIRRRMGPIVGPTPFCAPVLEPRFDLQKTHAKLAFCCTTPSVFTTNLSITELQLDSQMASILWG